MKASKSCIQILITGNKTQRPSGHQQNRGEIRMSECDHDFSIEENNQYNKCSKCGTWIEYKDIPLYETKRELKEKELQFAEAREDVKSYKYDLNTLVDIISDCVNKMSMEECYDTLKEVVDHYEKQKEQEPQPNLGGLVDEHCDLIKEQG